MKDELVGFEVAELAKEKGFRFVTNIVYNQKGQSMPCHSVKSWFENVKPPIDAPTQSLLQRWLREVHKIYVDVESVLVGLYKIEFICNNYQVLEFSRKRIGQSKTYEEALEEGLKSALKLIK